MMYLGTHPGHSRREHIGYYVVAEETVYTSRFETAAWWLDVRVAPGLYPLYSNGYYLLATLPGVNDGENFQSLYGGVAVGAAYDRNKNKGKPASYGIQSYLYDLPRMIEMGRVVLRSDYTFHRHHQFINWKSTQWPEKYDSSKVWYGPRGYWAVSSFPVPMLALPAPQPN